MRVETSQFGVLEVNDEEVYTFSQGIPGFEHLHRFVFVEIEETPFAYMQSVEEAALALIVTNPFVFYPEYDFVLPETDKQDLDIQDEQQVLVKCIVTAQNDFSKSTINLLAPLVLNVHTRCGKQLVLHQSSYMTKHLLLRQQEEK
ncbi:flagellar assembly protein FliW [Marinicrinis sediminis]|uniref:Flagellar assembly factor FliW n=1 Tax=Marinicrinis sediminis TaxID=1652465 RepID=A0ABW5RB25_9BACL